MADPKPYHQMSSAADHGYCADPSQVDFNNIIRNSVKCGKSVLYFICAHCEEINTTNINKSQNNKTNGSGKLTSIVKMWLKINKFTE